MVKTALKACLLAGLLALAALAGYAWRDYELAGQLPPGFILIQGRIEATRFAASARMSGVLTEILVQPGDRVTAGQVLGRVNSRSLATKLAEAKAQVALLEQRLAVINAEAERIGSELELADAELARAELMARAGLATDLDLPRLRRERDGVAAALDTARAKQQRVAIDRKQARETFQRLEQRQGRVEILAPRAGQVRAWRTQRGAVLESGQEVVELADPAQLSLVAQPDPVKLAVLSLGDDARIRLEGLPGVLLEGRVTILPDAPRDHAPASPSDSTEQAGHGSAKSQRLHVALTENPDQTVRPGMRGFAYIRSQRAGTWPDLLP